MMFYLGIILVGFCFGLGFQLARACLYVLWEVLTEFLNSFRRARKQALAEEKRLANIPHPSPPSGWG